MNNMTDCCVREMTLEEEIKALEIDENVKERLLGKYRRIEKECNEQNDYLFNCHCEIDRLNSAIVSQAKMIGNLEEEIKNRGIRYN